jgi:peptide/nickel transport system substrate-binding protein
MNRRFDRFTEQSVRSYAARLSAGDAVIAGALTLCTVIASFVALTALVRSFQVTVPAYGGTLSEGIVGSPRFVNPLLAVSDSDRDLVALTYAGLMGHDASGKLIPVLAEKYMVSPDGLTYDFTLRNGLTWSDGTTITADDVVFTIQKAQDQSLKSPAYADWANIRAEALDSRTIRFTLPKQYALFLEDTTLGIIPKHVWQNVAAQEFPFAPQNTIPVGAGPFTVAKVTRDSSGTITGYTLDAFPKYVLGKPYLSHINFSFFTDAESLAEARSKGTVASAYGIAAPDVASAPYARVFGVFFNSDKNPALADVRVRKALSLAIDRNALTQKVLGGYAKPTIGPLPEGSGVPPLPLPSDATRLDDARSALTAAGYTFDGGTNSWSKAGTKLTMTLTTSNVPELRAVASQIQTDWQNFGIPVNVELHEQSSFAQQVIRPRAYGALLFGEVVGTTPDLYAFWSSSARTGTGLNIANYQNKDVDDLLAKARTQTDASARAQLLAQAQQKIADDYPAAFLYTPDFLYAKPARISGIQLSQLTTPSDRIWGVENWYRYSEHVWPVFARNVRASATQ